MRRSVTRQIVAASTIVALVLAGLAVDGAREPAESTTDVTTNRRERLVRTIDDDDGATPDAVDSSVMTGDAPCVVTPADDPSPSVEVVPASQAFVMPDGARYEPQVALVEVREGASLAEVDAALAAADGIVARRASAEEIDGGLIRVEVEEGVSVEAAVNALYASGDVVALAQPNYAYVQLEAGMASDLRALLDNADEAGLVDAWPLEDESVETDEPSGASDATGERMDFDTADLDGEWQAPASTALEKSVSDDEGAAGGETEADEGDEPSAVESTPIEAAAQDDVDVPDTLVEALAASASVNDPRAPSQWALSSMRVYEAWALAQAERPSSGAAVTVAVLDTGFDVAHEDLRANVVAAYNAHADSTSTSALAAGSATANSRHGTHVAGIVSAVAGNGVGVAGVSHNARVMPIRISDDRGVAYTSDLVAAYNYLMARRQTYNVRVVNLSMGVANVAMRSDDAFLRKVDQAYAAGIVTVAAAGNSTLATPPFSCYPADYETVVSVMNLTRSGSSVARSPSSNYNAANETRKNVSAPGTDILSTAPGNAYGTMSGTSMAAPAVAGVLALEFAADPTLTAAQATRLLYESAQDLGAAGFDEVYGYGEVDAARAVQAARARLASSTPDGAASSDSSLVGSQTQVAGVVALIAALPPASGLTLSNRAAVVSARAAYDALTSAQKADVDVTTLVAAERRIAELERINAQLSRGLSVSYRAHVQSIGWQDWTSGEGALAGTTGRSLRLEALNVRLANQVLSGSIQCRAHVQDVGWQEWADGPNGLAGTTGQSRRVEAIQVRLTGEVADYHDVWYRVHAQSFGWMGWTKNGECAGTAGYGRRVEAIQILVRRKGSTAPGSTTDAFRSPISYQAYVQGTGWQSSVSDGATAGTVGRSLRLEALRLSLPQTPYAGSLQYRSYVQGSGWEGVWAHDGATSGAPGRARRVEAIQVRLTGAVAGRYDVWYRVHAQSVGWMGWARDGASAGTVGYGRRIEAVEVMLLEKGSAAPGATANSFLST